MATLDSFEEDLLADYEAGNLQSVVTKAEIARLRSAARATATKDRRVNIRLSSGDLQDIQAKALQEGLPYQTLIASILHKYVTGRLEERGVQADQADQATRSKPNARRPGRKTGS